MSFKEWLAKISPDGGGQFNIDVDFGKTKSKDIRLNRPEPDPEKLFFGVSKKQDAKLHTDMNSKIGGNDENNHI